MPSKKKVAKKAAKSKAKNAVDTAQPYVQRLVEDDDLRDNLREAYDAARDAYGRAAGAKKPSAVLDDKKLHSDLRNATDSLRAATEALREPEKKKGGGIGIGKLLLIAVVGAIIALVLSEDLRKTVLDSLFGAEEEFEYTGATPPPPAGGSPPAS